MNQPNHSNHKVQDTEKMARVRVKRQDGRNKESYWETFLVKANNRTNVITLLDEIRRKPVNESGKAVNPVVWDCSCLEEVCGACSMVINGKARQACSTLLGEIGFDITLEPMNKFPVVRDLRIDRSRMFESLKKVKAWIPVDGYYDLGAGARMTDEEANVRYELSKCMTCGVCLQVCPQVNDSSSFMGAAPISQARLFNLHPVGESLKDERLDALMDEGGIMGCGKAQNCVKACPKEIPLTESLADIYKETTIKSIKDIFRK